MTIPSQWADGAFEKFLEDFLDPLAASTFSDDGNLSAYLEMPAEYRGNDEANIVDMRITRCLITALGYAPEEIDYNQQKGNLRPDFAIRIPEYPRPACFIVEDKNSATTELRRHRPQLQSYMTQAGASRGMLVNGHAILVYDQMEGGLKTPAVEIPLQQAVQAWAGDDLLASGKSGMAGLEANACLPLFSALWQRFRRGGFSGFQKLIDELTLQNEKGNNAPHKLNGKTWTNAYSRIAIVPVTHENAGQLTEAVEGLISEFENDASAQFAAIERDYRVYETASKQIPSENTTLRQQEDGIVETALQLMAGAELEAREEDAVLLRKILRGEALACEFKQIERRMYALHRNMQGKGTDKDPIRIFLDKARAFTEKRRRYFSKLKAQHKDSIEVFHDFGIWKEKTASLVFQSDDDRLLQREFMTQTAYLVIIRILLVRIMEDKGLVNRMFTNGGVSLWFLNVEPHYLEHAIGQSADFFLELAYTSAQHIYAHFFSERTVLDWYVPDRNAVVRVLHALAGFDLADINRDIIGAVYNQYVEARHKHESGMYFTPPEVVSFMLDRIGYKGADIIGKRLIDLSCGSGGFLVEAATRLVSAYRDYWRAQGNKHVPAEQVQNVLNEIRESLHGIDLNPFACALAETNLLIQVIDLFGIACQNKQPATLERFHIYNSDSLSFSADTLASQSGTLRFPDEDLPVEDQVKAGIGHWRDKFDFVVGNPPYVKANESSDGMTAYRERIKREYLNPAVRNAMTQKWDLFVPFVAASRNLLRKENESLGIPPGKLAIITSNAIETVPYSEALRKLLALETTVDEVHFFPGIRLFEDAAVQNTITIASNRLPHGQTHTERYWHKTAPRWGSLSQADTQKLRQTHYTSDIFRQALPKLTQGKNTRSIPLEEVFYISKGMVLNANEKTDKGAFRMEDLIASSKDAIHIAAFSGSKDIIHFGIKNIRYLEYGTSRVPGQLSRPTFPELYDRPKLMVAEFGGFAYDDGAWDEAGFLKCNHSVFILMRWCELAGVKAKSIGKNLPRERYEALSARIDPWYALAFLNSEQMRMLLAGVNRSAIAGRLQPDDLRQISIPVPEDPEVAAAISALAQKASKIQKRLLALRGSGWSIDEARIQAPTLIPDGVPALPFGRARVKWGLEITRGDLKAHDLQRVERRLFHGKREAIRLPASVPENAVEWLRRQFLSLPEGTTLGEIEASSFKIPETPDLAIRALVALLKEEENARALQDEITKTREKISEQLQGLFREIEHPPVKRGKSVS